MSTLRLTIADGVPQDPQGLPGAHLATTIDCSEQNLEYIDAVDNFSAVEILNLSFNRIQRIPESISLLLHLQHLNLSHNCIFSGFRGSPLTYLHAIPHLRSLNLTGNPIFSTYGLPGFPQLEVLHVSSCMLYSAQDFADFLAACPILQQLACADNPFWDEQGPSDAVLAALACFDKTVGHRMKLDPAVLLDIPMDDSYAVRYTITHMPRALIAAVTSAVGASTARHELAATDHVCNAIIAKAPKLAQLVHSECGKQNFCVERVTHAARALAEEWAGSVEARQWSAQRLPPALSRLIGVPTGRSAPTSTRGSGASPVRTLSTKPPRSTRASSNSPIASRSPSAARVDSGPEPALNLTSLAKRQLRSMEQAARVRGGLVTLVPPAAEPAEPLRVLYPEPETDASLEEACRLLPRAVARAGVHAVSDDAAGALTVRWPDNSVAVSIEIDTAATATWQAAGHSDQLLRTVAFSQEFGAKQAMVMIDALGAGEVYAALPGRSKPMLVLVLNRDGSGQEFEPRSKQVRVRWDKEGRLQPASRSLSPMASAATPTAAASVAASAPTASFRAGGRTPKAVARAAAAMVILDGELGPQSAPQDIVRRARLGSGLGFEYDIASRKMRVYVRVAGMAHVVHVGERPVQPPPWTALSPTQVREINLWGEHISASAQEQVSRMGLPAPKPVESGDAPGSARSRAESASSRIRAAVAGVDDFSALHASLSKLSARSGSAASRSGSRAPSAHQAASSSASPPPANHQRAVSPYTEQVARPESRASASQEDSVSEVRQARLSNAEHSAAEEAGRGSSLSATLAAAHSASPPAPRSASSSHSDQSARSESRASQQQQQQQQQQQAATAGEPRRPRPGSAGSSSVGTGPAKDGP